MMNSQSRCSFFTCIRTELRKGTGEENGGGLTCWSSSFRMESRGGEGVTSQQEEEEGEEGQEEEEQQMVV